MAASKHLCRLMLPGASYVPYLSIRPQDKLCSRTNAEHLRALMGGFIVTDGGHFRPEYYMFSCISLLSPILQFFVISGVLLLTCVIVPW